MPYSCPSTGLLCHAIRSCSAGRVGKTSLLLRWAHDSFDASQPPTLQASFLAKTLTLDGSPVEVNVWDTAGQVRRLLPVCCPQCHSQPPYEQQPLAKQCRMLSTLTPIM